MALMYPQNGDMIKLLKSARKNSARLSAGQGVQKLFGQFPNAQVMKLEGASLRVLVCVRML